MGTKSLWRHSILLSSSLSTLSKPTTANHVHSTLRSPFLKLTLNKKALVFSSYSSSSFYYCTNSTINSIDGGDSNRRRLTSELYLYNIMSKMKELVRPRVERKVGMYVCGVTVYNFNHVGHARVYVTFNILYRYFFTIRQALRDLEEILGGNSESNLENFAPKGTLDCLAKFHSKFESSMSDDLHTLVALAALSEPLKIIKDLLHTRKGKK